MQTIKKREITAKKHGHSDDKNRLLYKGRYMDGYDTQLIAYSKSFEILMMFAIGLIYPIILGHVAMSAVRKMIFDQYVAGVQAKCELEDGENLKKDNGDNRV